MFAKMIEKEEIHNFELIIGLAKDDPNFENVSHIIHLLDRFDKKRESEDPELKSAVFAVVKEILEQRIAKPIFGYSPTAPLPDPIPETVDEVLNYLDKYWGNPAIPHNDIGRGYLLFFEKGTKLDHNTLNTVPR